MIKENQGKYITDTYIKPSTYYTEDSSFLGTRIPLDCTTKQEYDLYDSGVQVFFSTYTEYMTIYNHSDESKYRRLTTCQGGEPGEYIIHYDYHCKDFLG